MTDDDQTIRDAIEAAWSRHLRAEGAYLEVAFENAVARAVGEWLVEHHDAVMTAIREANS